MTQAYKTMGEAYKEMYAEFNDAQILKLKKAYATLKGKRLSLDNNKKLTMIVNKMTKDQLVKVMNADIPFLSTSAMSTLVIKHKLKYPEIDKLRVKEEAEEDYTHYPGQVDPKKDKSDGAFVTGDPTEPIEFDGGDTTSILNKANKEVEQERGLKQPPYVEAYKLPRQLKNPKKETMVSKDKYGTIVIDKTDWPKYKAKGWKLAEEIDEGKYTQYSNLLVQKGKLFAKGFLPTSITVTRINKEIEKEKKKLGIKEDVDLELDEVPWKYVMGNLTKDDKDTLQDFSDNFGPRVGGNIKYATKYAVDKILANTEKNLRKLSPAGKKAYKDLKKKIKTGPVFKKVKEEVELDLDDGKVTDAEIDSLRTESKSDDELEHLKLMNKALKTFAGSPKQKEIIKQLNVVRKRLGLKPLKEEEDDESEDEKVKKAKDKADKDVQVALLKKKIAALSTQEAVDLYFNNVDSGTKILDEALRLDYVRQYTQNNDHFGARVYIAQQMRDKEMESIYKGLETIHRKYYSYAGNHAVITRDKLEKVLYSKINGKWGRKLGKNIIDNL